MASNKKSNKKPVSKATKSSKKPTKKKASRPQTAPVKVKTAPLIPDSNDLDLVPKWEDTSLESSTFDHQDNVDDVLEAYPTTTWGRVKLSIMDFFKTVFKIRNNNE